MQKSLSLWYISERISALPLKSIPSDPLIYIIIYRRIRSDASHGNRIGIGFCLEALQRATARRSRRAGGRTWERLCLPWLQQRADTQPCTQDTSSLSSLHALCKRLGSTSLSPLDATQLLCCACFTLRSAINICRSTLPPWLQRKTDHLSTNKFYFRKK